MVSSLIHKRADCRLCGSERLQLAVPLEAEPVVTPNVGLKAGSDADVERLAAPMDLYLCGQCGHLQIIDVVDPSLQYRNYLYRTSISLGLVEHFRGYAEEVLGRIAPQPGMLVVEFGSNDGSLLRHFQARGMRVLGVDPAERIAAEATAAGVETIAAFFGADIARRIAAEKGPAAIIVANNVLANINDLADVVAGLDVLLAPDGVFVFETQDGSDVIRHNLLDTIYHEHLSYFMAKPLVSFFAAKGFELIDVLPIATKGGSFRCTVQRAGGPRAAAPSVAAAIAVEERDGMYDLATYHAYAGRIAALKTELADMIGAIRSDGGTVAGYGASVGTVALLHQLRLVGAIDFLVDDSPFKAALVGPGYEIPILPATALMERKPQAVVVFAWRYAEPIIAKNPAYHGQGGRFIVPLPKVTVI
jgi:SAM-dependent methyltransferase